MEKDIQDFLIKRLFFRPDLVEIIERHLTFPIQVNRILFKYNTKSFLTLLEGLNQNHIQNTDSQQKTTLKINMNHDTAKKTKKIINNDLNSCIDSKITQNLNSNELEKIKIIIQKDDIENLYILSQNEPKKLARIKVIDDFLEVRNLEIPLIHYSVIKSSMKCFKFLLLNGADPYQILNVSPNNYHDIYQWSCIGLAINQGNWEILKIFQERNIVYIEDNLEAGILGYRNKYLRKYLHHSNNIQKDWIIKGVICTIINDNYKLFKQFLLLGVDINVKDINFSTKKFEI